MGGGFNKIFGGSAVAPSDNTYDAIALTGNLILNWPTESAAGENVVADLLDVTPAIPGGQVITLPDARGGSLGVAMVFNNLSSLYSFTVNDNGGNLVLTVAPGTVWLLYISDNSTQAGDWETFQYGAQAGSVNLAAIAGSGLTAIGSSLNQSMPVSSKNANYTAVAGDRATVILWTGGAGNLILPDPGTLGNNWFICVRNIGSGDLTVAPAVGQIDLASTKAFTAGVGSAIIFTDGQNYYTLGYGSSGTGTGFNYTTIDISGTGDYTITGAQLNKVAYLLTGVLTGNRNFVVPASVQEYWINNQTTGAFTLTVKTAGGTGQIVSQPGQSIVYCDGTNVVPAISALALPLAIGSGGTGATTAGGARTALGSTSIGDALFTAASAVAARGQLGSTTVGDALFIAASVNAALNTLANGTLTGTLSVTGNFGAGNVTVTTATIPAVGIYRNAALSLGFATNGVLAGYFDNNQILHLANALDILDGGTGATTVAGALANLGLAAMDMAATVGTIAQRDGSGHLFATYFNQSSALENPSISTTGGVFVENAAADGYLRKMSMANFRTAFDSGNFTAAGTGYQKFASGIILQWGTVTGIGSQSISAVAFTPAFPNACWGVVLTQLVFTNTAQAASSAEGITRTVFNLRNMAGNTQNIFWMAVGN